MEKREKKNNEFKFRLSEKENKILEEDASLRGLNKSEYVRFLIFGNVEKNREKKSAI